MVILQFNLLLKYIKQRDSGNNFVLPFCNWSCSISTAKSFLIFVIELSTETSSESNISFPLIISISFSILFLVIFKIIPQVIKMVYITTANIEVKK